MTSEIWFWVLLVLVLLFAYIYYNILQDKLNNLPPGPIPLPLIGNLHQIGLNQYLGFYKLYQKYGSICTLYMGPAIGRVILISGDIKLFKETFNNPLFDGRPTNKAWELVIGDRNGLILGSGKSCSEKRRFALRHLRSFGFGKHSMEEYIIDEIQEILEWFRKQEGKPIHNLRRRFSLAVVNSLWRIVSGVRYDHDDLKLIKIMEELEHTIKEISKGSISSAFILFFPKMAEFFSNLSGWNRLYCLMQSRLDLFRQIIKQHKSTLQNNEIPRDFTDAFLLEVQKTTDPKSNFHVDNDPEQSLLSILSDLFSAGSQTTSDALAWIILYLLHYPEAQIKAYDEIKFVVGNSRLPSLKDRPSLPYCDALLLEILRSVSLANTTTPHVNVEDINFHGYFIPKGTTLFGNIHSIHQSTELWKDPKNFRPERFLLIKEGKPTGIDKTVTENLLPFGSGKRSCIGEILAKDTLFIFLTSIIQSFEIKPNISDPFPGLDPAHGSLTLNPRPYSVTFKERST